MSKAVEILMYLVGVNIIIFFHELGHYLAGKNWDLK